MNSLCWKEGILEWCHVEAFFYPTPTNSSSNYFSFYLCMIFFNELAFFQNINKLEN